jgi:hypothetical protein
VTGTGERGVKGGGLQGLMVRAPTATQFVLLVGFDGLELARIDTVDVGVTEDVLRVKGSTSSVVILSLGSYVSSL